MSFPTRTLREADKRLQLAYSSGPEERGGERKEAASRLLLLMMRKVAPHAVNKLRAQESRSINPQLQTGMTPPSSVAEGEHVVQGWHLPASPWSRGTSTPVAQPLPGKRTRYRSCREEAWGSQLPLPGRKLCSPPWGKGGNSILKEILRRMAADPSIARAGQYLSLDDFRSQSFSHLTQHEQPGPSSGPKQGQPCGEVATSM